MFTGFGFNDFELDPTIVFEIVIAVWNKFWQQSCQIFWLPAPESSDFIFVVSMYAEIEHGKHMGSLKEQPWETRHGKCYFLTWEYLRKRFICPHPQDFSEFPRQNAAVASQARRLTTGPRSGATARWWASCAQPLGSRSGAMTKINHHGSRISYYQSDLWCYQTFWILWELND